MRVTRESCGRGAEGSTWARLEGGSKNVPARASAAYYGREAIVEVLLAAGCSVDLPSNNGMTPLMGAAEANHAGTVKLLLDGGADKALVCNNGRTALWYAEQSGNDAVVALLHS